MKPPGYLERSLRPYGPRLGSVFLVGAGVVGSIGAMLPGPPDVNRPGLAAVCAIAIGLGVITWFLPWERLPWWSNLLLLPIALAILSFGNIFNGSAPYSYGSYYVVAFVWLGHGAPAGHVPADVAAPRGVLPPSVPGASRGTSASRPAP